MKKILFLIVTISLILPNVSYASMEPVASMLPEGAKTDFSNAGITGGIPVYNNTVIVTEKTEAAIESAIQNAPDYSRIVLPAGMYDVETIEITRNNVVLVGDGCGLTTIRFGDNDSGIVIGNTGSIGDYVPLTSNASKLTNSITLGNVSGFKVNDYVHIRQDDDTNLLRLDYSRRPDEEWVKNNQTQINKIVAKNGNTLILEGALHLDYKTELHARVGKISNMVTGVGIENLTVERTKNKDTIQESSNIFFKFTANSWVQGVHSINSIRSHFYLNRSYKNELRGNFADRSFNNGGGGHGYGFRVQSWSTDNLIENNSSELTRHSYIVQVGGNGNVFGYNHSTNVYGSVNDDGSPGEIYSDLSVHGGFAFSNLFEGNQAQAAKIDNIHASNVYNTFFRNRLEQDVDTYWQRWREEHTKKGESTPHIWIHENQYFNAFLANEISFPNANRRTITRGFDDGRTRDNYTTCDFVLGSDGKEYGQNDPSCVRTEATTINHGTYDYLLDKETWDSSINQRDFPDSVYLSSKPDFWGSQAWPPFGPDTQNNAESQKIIPAKARFLSAKAGQGNYCYIGTNANTHAQADVNNDGKINFQDYQQMKSSTAIRSRQIYAFSTIISHLLE